MPIENIINKQGRDVEILRNGEIITTTKAMFSKNRFNFKATESIKIGDTIRTIDTTKEYTVMDINPIKDGRGKLSHYQVII